jgi:hypothetical protein
MPGFAGLGHFISIKPWPRRGDVFFDLLFACSPYNFGFASRPVDLVPAIGILDYAIDASDDDIKVN